MSKKKRFISLLVAFTMVFSMIVPSLSFASFSDIEGSKYEEAIEKLVALDTIKGYEDGTFKPNNSITRAELATIITFVLGLQDAANLAQYNNSQFSDVVAGAWYTGYINIAANEKVVSGYPDGTFRPNEKVSYAEATTMLINALGLNQVVNKSGGTWPSNYMSKAAQLGITKDITGVSGSDSATRGDICLMAWETLLQEQWGATGFNDQGEITYGKLGKTLLESKYEDFVYYDKNNKAQPKYFEDVEITATPESNNALETNQIEIKMEDIASILKITRTNASKDYAYKSDSSGDKVVVILPDGTDTSNMLGMEASIFFGKDNKVAFIKVTSDGIKGKLEVTSTKDEIEIDDEDYDVLNTAKIFINNIELTKAINTITDNDVTTKLAYIENLSETLGDPIIRATALTNSSNKVTQLNVEVAGTFTIQTTESSDSDYKFTQFVVRNIRSDSTLVDLGGTRQFNADDIDEENEDIIITRNGKAAKANDIEVGDVVMVGKNTNGKIRTIVATDNKVEGTLDRITSNYGIKVDGTTYTQGANAMMSTSDDIEETENLTSNVSALLDENIVLHLDSNGNYVLVMGNCEVELGDQYALVAKTPQASEVNYDDNDNPYIRLQIIDSNGNKTSIKVTGKASSKLNKVSGKDILGLTVSSGDDWTDNLIDEFTKGTFISYSTESDGKTVKATNLTKLENSSTAANGAQMDSNTVLSEISIPDEDSVVKNSNKSIKVSGKSYYVSENTIILNQNTDKLERVTGWETIVKSNDETSNALRGKTVSMIYNSSTRLIKYLVINDDGTNYQAETDNYGIITDILSGKNENDDKVWMVEIYSNGERNTYEIADISTDLSTVLFGKEGDFVKFDLEDGIFVQTDENDIIIDMEEFLDNENYDEFLSDGTDDRDQLIVDEIIDNLIVFKKVDGTAIDPVTVSDDVIVYDLSGNAPEMSELSELEGRVVMYFDTDGDTEEYEIVIILE